MVGQKSNSIPSPKPKRASICYFEAGPDDKLQEFPGAQKFRVFDSVVAPFRIISFGGPGGSCHLLVDTWVGFFVRNLRKDSNPSCGWGNMGCCRPVFEVSTNVDLTKATILHHVLNESPSTKTASNRCNWDPTEQKHTPFTPTLRITAPYNGKV